MMIRSSSFSCLIGLLLVSALHYAAACCTSADCRSGQTCLGAPDSCTNPNAPFNVGRCGTVSVSSCFSKNSIVDVLGKGPTPMQSLKVGDKILTGDSGYETVYAFGHWDDVSKTDFLEIEARIETGASGESQKTTFLQVTRDHLLYVHDRSFVPAIAVKVGDVIGTESAEQRAIVKTIRSVKETGLYAPLTPSGTLLVDGLKASCYVSLQEGLPENLELNGIPLVSQHLFSHWALSPIRLLCLGVSPSLCENRNTLDKENGYAWFTKLGFSIVDTLESFHNRSALQYTLAVAFAAFFGVFRGLEIVFGPLLAPTAVLAAAVLGRSLFKSKK
ncbi:Protein hedgehog [Seminavis robusta]|uniref:Protein hedgehog n=1 Tax=Seminavis robusta TaxID=568900 RepID=A0A9N8HP12_9STRA|nr:Protein hedgehog [Seminavis robusta]|eukprot:Sro866_g212960.1 Protein hedgehog (331) ;mRNA; f:8954-9946